MIISHKHKFIFLKTNKTAGTSIEIALSKYCDHNDIITPISPEDEKIRKTLGYRGPQNYRFPLREYRLSDLVGLFKGQRKSFYNHISANEIKARIEEQIWDSYYKFCFERNPCERVISLYYYRFPSEPRPAISKFIDSKAPLILKRRGYGLYTINGEIVVNKVCRYENITEELEAVRKQLGLPEEIQLPTAKSRFRKDKKSYHDILGDKEKQKIAKIFCDEINLFGYELYGNDNP